MARLEEDRNLLDAFRRGDRDALSTVYRTYVKDVIAVVRSRAPRADLDGNRVGPDLVMDIVHDVFVRAFADSARAGYDGIRPYEPYLARIARNLIIDRWRASAREDRLIIEVDELSSDRDTRRDAQLSTTRAFLTTVNDADRRFVALRFVEGLSQQLVADTLGISKRKVRSWEARIYTALSEYLRQARLL